MQLLLRYAAFVAILWLELKGEILNSIKENAAAFCTKSDQTTSFPISPPEFYIPWVWDAVYDMRTDYVDVTTLPQLACEFNKTILHRLIQLYPQYSPQLGDGVDSKVLVKGNVDKNKFDFIKSMINARMMCVFYSNGIQAHRTISLPVNIKRAFAAMSTAQIQCPVPPKSITWDSLRIERNVTKVFKFLKSAVEFSTNRTSVFPVCKLHHTDSTVSNASESESGNSNMRVYEYELSICTATQRSSREKLVEWIEYHLLQGVDHFFIYNTMYPAERQHELADMLADYIQQGIVTLIAWPYANCVTGMIASGRSTSFIDTDHVNPTAENYYSKHWFSFHPPNRITQSSALASCYTRFRHSTRFMAHIDDDEFFKVALPATKADVDKPLLLYTHAMFSKFPAAPALKFSPVMMCSCSTPAHFHVTTSFGALPRLGKYPFGRLGPLGDGKMIMRTSAVDMFFVHYLTALANGVTQRQSLMSHPRRAVLLHYKTSAHLAGEDITGRRLPLNTTFEAISACNNSHFLPMDRPPSDQLFAQQKEYVIHRDRQQQQLIYETYCQGTVHCKSQSEVDSMECEEAKKLCAASAKWSCAVLEGKENFTTHYFERKFIRSLLHNARQRLVN